MRSGLALLLLLVATSGTADAAEFDVVLAGGIVIDGTGSPGVQQDVGLRNRRIAALGDLSRASSARRIDARGLVVAPGFIDVHNHSDKDVIFPAFRAAPGMIHQGVTTAVFGVDGELDLQTFRAVRHRLTQTGVGVNFAMYIGHNGLRLRAMGMADRHATPAELRRMAADVESAMDEGALGLSTGLMYLPGAFAPTEEIVELARVVAPYGGLYDSHDRDPAFDLIASVEECLSIARHAGIAANVAHIKAVGVQNAGKSADLIRLIEQARARGESVTADVYPFDGAATRLVAEILVPEPGSPLAATLERASRPETGADRRAAALVAAVDLWRTTLADRQAQARVRVLTETPPVGLFSWVKTVGYGSFRVVRSRDPRLVGRMVVEVAHERGLSPFEFLVDRLLDEGAEIKLTLGAIQEAEVQAFLLQPWVMIASDGREGGLEGGRGHPRFRGSFARVLGHYVRDLGLLPLEVAIRRMTGLPADYLRLDDRGRIAVGAVADVVVFDPRTVRANATWDDPAPYASGMHYVFVNGVPALDDGVLTGLLAGRYLPFRARTPDTGPRSETPR